MSVMVAIHEHYLISIKNCAYLSELGSITKPLVPNFHLLELQIRILEVVRRNLRYWKLEMMEASMARLPSLPVRNSMKLKREETVKMPD